MKNAGTAAQVAGLDQASRDPVFKNRLNAELNILQTPSADHCVRELGDMAKLRYLAGGSVWNVQSEADAACQMVRERRRSWSAP